MAASEEYGVVVVGAGQAGISLSYFLARHGLNHVVLERDTPFSAWKTRWDGFYTNTPNWMNTLPRAGFNTVPGDDPNAFATREEIVEYLEEYRHEVDPPLICPSEVTGIEQLPSGCWQLRTSTGSYRARNVAVCTGAMSSPRIPALAGALDRSVPQVHSLDFRNPADIETSRVLIVGSGSSGVQICKEFCRARTQREIHLATSDVLVLPETVMGIQVHRFLHLFGVFDVRVHSPLGRLMYRNIEVKGDPIRPPTPEDLARDEGVILHGRLAAVRGSRLAFDDDSTLDTRDLTVLWCTGYRGRYEWIRPRAGALAIDERGYPVHERGVIDDAEGLYFVGLRYQHTVASHDIYGVGADAKYVAEHIAGRLLGRAPAGRSKRLRVFG
jgi:putative flavoprotein involved in K+ transport